MDHKTAGEKFCELLEVKTRLRGVHGCPWDKEQTHASLKPFLREESHELLDALDSLDTGKIREELGDLLHQIVFHCQIAAERGAFTAADVVSALKEKIMRRHPHVFSTQPLADSETVLRQWGQIKNQERDDELKSALGNLPKSMPALARSQRIADRASRAGFDWPTVEPVWEKIDEELSELKLACSSADKEHMAEELGDLFFSLVNLARFIGVQGEDQLGHSPDRTE
jgi:tetrapyrrole methylase family protein / MazG family protein